MCCEGKKSQIGRFLDHELPANERAGLRSHLEDCEACRVELESLQDLTATISGSADVIVPTDLWNSIERRLYPENQRPAAHAATWHRVLRSRRWALAASLAFVVGLGMFGLSLVDSPAQASSINFGILLDALPLDAQKAFRKFVLLYDAQPGSPLEAREFAPSLDFDTPKTLPGGFQLQNVYLLRFGDRPGVAASYVRGDDFLGAIFHTPVEKEDFGTHKDYPCVVGKHHGHKVEVGEWKMIHLTTSTTCHCVLSQLDEVSEIPAVMAAVAPGASATHGHEHD